MRKGNLYIVSGPSGAGKGTVVRHLASHIADVWVSVSATTRAPRPGEQEGVHYFFLTAQEFERRLAAGEFLEWAEVHGNRYGTLRGPVERRVREGMQVVLEIDPQGASQVKALVPGSVLIFVTAPTWEELRRRLEGRGSETPEEVAARMRVAETEMGFAGGYDHVVINDDVSRAADEIASIIDSHSGR